VACGTSVVLADLSPNLQRFSRARIRLSVVYPLTAFIRLHAVLGAPPDYGGPVALTAATEFTLLPEIRYR